MADSRMRQGARASAQEVVGGVLPETFEKRMELLRTQVTKLGEETEALSRKERLLRAVKAQLQDELVLEEFSLLLQLNPLSCRYTAVILSSQDTVCVELRHKEICVHRNWMMPEGKVLWIDFHIEHASLSELSLRVGNDELNPYEKINENCYKNVSALPYMTPDIHDKLSRMMWDVRKIAGRTDLWFRQERLPCGEERTVLICKAAKLMMERYNAKKPFHARVVAVERLAVDEFQSLETLEGRARTISRMREHIDATHKLVSAVEQASRRMHDEQAMAVSELTMPDLEGDLDGNAYRFYTRGLQECLRRAPLRSTFAVHYRPFVELSSAMVVVQLVHKTKKLTTLASVAMRRVDREWVADVCVASDVFEQPNKGLRIVVFQGNQTTPLITGNVPQVVSGNHGKRTLPKDVRMRLYDEAVESVEEAVAVLTAWKEKEPSREKQLSVLISRLRQGVYVL